MPSKDVAMVVREDSLSAAIWVRRADGGFVFKRIDARMAAASRLAASYQKEASASERAPTTVGKPSSFSM
jgi:hypothetical protein